MISLIAIGIIIIRSFLLYNKKGDRERQTHTERERERKKKIKISVLLRFLNVGGNGSDSSSGGGNGSDSSSGGGNGSSGDGDNSKAGSTSAVVVRTVTTDSAEISPNQLTHSSLSSFSFTPFCLLGMRGMGWTKLMKINQPINQPTNRPTDQPSNQPNDRPTNQPTKPIKLISQSN
ncbi:unnamed protein product [Brugia pahangi]|uniref:Uncharacterized protein n=1 Tax=Brugia pahangi TaxID=6280 RepID=A0A0N4T181_BRUPA|nr:unnamed protein product [Brugia pahangi]